VSGEVPLPPVISSAGEKQKPMPASRPWLAKSGNGQRDFM
jgi:hypothetical protein